MDLFVELFGSMLAFVYHCFDRIVIHGYLGSLSRPDQVREVARSYAAAGSRIVLTNNDLINVDALANLLVTSAARPTQVSSRSPAGPLPG